MIQLKRIAECNLWRSAEISVAMVTPLRYLQKALQNKVENEVVEHRKRYTRRRTDDFSRKMDTLEHNSFPKMNTSISNIYF